MTIVEMIEAAMEQHQVTENPSVEQILEAERETYEFIESRWQIAEHSGSSTSVRTHCTDS